MTRCAVFAVLLALPLAAQVRFEDIRKGEGANWLTYSGDYASRRHSPLKQIDVSNAANLTAKWTYHVEGSRRLETTPLVYDGVMYITGTNEVHAIDARTGRRIWIYHDDQSRHQGVNRGVALLGNRVFFVTSDAHLFALDRRTGGVLWQTEYASADKGYGATLAPLALKDRVIVGVGGGDGGVRGFVSAFSAATGEQLWRHWTIPARGEPGSESWGDFPAAYAGAATWMTGSYDPELNLLYWQTGNPWPDLYGKPRTGDNLYTDSIVALDADTGNMKWYFQFTPHDTHDWDAQSIPVLVDMNYQGRMRKLLLHPNRNGFFYVLDRTDGKFLSATRMADKMNWASGIDAKGRPVVIPDTDPTRAGRLVCPSKRGAANWMSPSFDPATGLLFVPMFEQCDVYTTTETVPEPGKGLDGGGADELPSDPGQGFLRAIDPKTGERRWSYAMTGPTTMWAGAVSTAGGVVFFGDDEGQLIAVDARTGRTLWHYNMGQNLTASPITFSVDGKQYVSIAAATDVFTFGLFDGAAN
ncbi:MAG: PQQ-dependent dehydrogenase, methanol/ethanol family [Bryobacteraceae bacterium]